MWPEIAIFAPAVASARQTTYKDSRANPKGKLPDDVWFLRPQDAAAHAYVEKGGERIGCDAAEKMGYFDVVSDTWNVSRVCGTFKEREGSGCGPGRQSFHLDSGTLAPGLTLEPGGILHIDLELK